MNLVHITCSIIYFLIYQQNVYHTERILEKKFQINILALLIESINYLELKKIAQTLKINKNWGKKQNPITDLKTEIVQPEARIIKFANSKTSSSSW